MIRAFRWFSGRVEAWTRRPELRRRCAWLHHGPNPHGSTEYKLVARRAAPDGELPSDHLPNGCRVVVTTKIDPTRSAANLALDTHSPIQAERGRTDRVRRGRTRTAPALRRRRGRLWPAPANTPTRDRIGSDVDGSSTSLTGSPVS